MLAILSVALFSALVGVSGHSSIWTPAMYGFNVTDKTFPYDNRPVAPIKNMDFNTWWFHNHLDFPPNAGDFFELPAGKPATAEIACNKGATSFFASSEGGDIRDPNDPNNPCPRSPSIAYHTKSPDDLQGCALAIAYKSDARQVQPEDFAVFSVNHTCVSKRFTDFQVPERMPPCPEGGCTCAFFWVHSPKTGGEENYMNGFKCNVTNSISNVAVAKSTVPRRCGADLENAKAVASPANCTWGAKTPFYWFNKERNNMFEGDFSPPVYNLLYNFADGAQEDIFEDSYTSIPDPSPVAAMPVLANIGGDVGTGITINGTASVGAIPSSPASPIQGRECGSATPLGKRDVDLEPLQRDWKTFTRGGLRAMAQRRRTLSATHRSRIWSMW